MFVVVYNIYEKFDFGNSGKGGGKMSYFPLFIELKNKRCLVVGGGRIALHQAGVLKGFGAGVVVVAIKRDGRYCLPGKGLSAGGSRWTGACGGSNGRFLFEP